MVHLNEVQVSRNSIVIKQIIVPVSWGINSLQKNCLQQDFSNTSVEAHNKHLVSVVHLQETNCVTRVAASNRFAALLLLWIRQCI